MCGICGVASPSGVPDEAADWVRSMAAALAHRGPDDEGFHTDAHAALGARRLSIIDLPGGHQPISNEDGTVWVVCNGEIYNHAELRSDLEARGHRFRTRSDTEVVVHAYEQYGRACPAHLAGMFAFAVWDAGRRRLFIARDRLGQKPLYYALRGDLLCFGSELKALLRLPGIDTSIDRTALHHYLTLQYVPDPWSICRGVRKLPAAHALTFEDGGLRTERYWDLTFEPKVAMDDAEAAGELRRLLGQAVRRRLMSDVPVGAFLSGGIDSSIVVGLMAAHGARPVKTFSIGFNFEALNELPYARAVAERFGTEHHEFLVTPDRIDEDVPALAAAFDEPFADPSALLTYYLSRETRQHVTVALNGDGGDECFAGYPRYWLDRWVRPYAALPAMITQTVVPRLVDWLPEPRQTAIEANWVLGLKRLAQVARVSPKASVVRWGSFFDERLKAELYVGGADRPRDMTDTAGLLAADFDAAHAESWLDRTLAVDTRHYLCGDLLVKTDRTTMAHSLEGRSPFLDHELVEFAARLPTRFKLRGRHGKRILRRAFADTMPPGIAARPKRGFAAPIEAWLRTALRPLVHDLLLAADTRSADLFSRTKMTELVEAHERGRADHGRRLWALLMLETWLRQRTVQGASAT